MELNNKTLKEYRRIGHQLDPVVIVANGLTDNVQAEINRALTDHELIKVRVVTDDRVTKNAVIDEICSAQHAETVQVIGKIALLYRAAENQKPHLSNICRFRDNP